MATSSPNPAQLPLGQQLLCLRQVLSTNTTLITVLERVATLGLPNWYLAGGAVSQTVWNYASHLPPSAGIADYDVVYHDASDLSWDAEDAHIRAARALFADMPGIDVEVRNQARVHLWYGAKHGTPCPPHASVEGGIDSWISTSAMVGVRLGGEDGREWSVYAPRGLSDLFNVVARPNAVLGSKESYDKKTARWRGIWDKLTVEPWPTETAAAAAAITETSATATIESTMEEK
ncbi:hypothetical protein ISF_08242 [Cordyceps fumosorosea ARSEF 2679]|uniref:FAD binding domain protein n=1 Tax=Cordyceps fumosorosea (strain ARSEF 2679) TaxID=1081104 RepID=A0A167MQD1_CORFA|nr:hypothetical protein ISF_08242 [Cordyceps fumosorosea ARSEF 2679]OAA54641.1 hypothetical protein ISF_08242 [Cordyceps fumosorosea ARSEF 2679]